jgi:hypothetical protein
MRPTMEHGETLQGNTLAAWIQFLHDCIHIYDRELPPKTITRRAEVEGGGHSSANVTQGRGSSCRIERNSRLNHAVSEAIYTVKVTKSSHLRRSLSPVTVLCSICTTRSAITSRNPNCEAQVHAFRLLPLFAAVEASASRIPPPDFGFWSGQVTQG